MKGYAKIEDYEDRLLKVAGFILTFSWQKINKTTTTI